MPFPLSNKLFLLIITSHYHLLRLVYHFQWKTSRRYLRVLPAYPRSGPIIISGIVPHDSVGRQPLGQRQPRKGRRLRTTDADINCIDTGQ